MQLMVAVCWQLPICLPDCPLCACCHRVQLLEISQYLENYLWPHFEAGMAGSAAYQHLMSMVVMVNQKFREQVPGWACFQQQNKVGWQAWRASLGNNAPHCCPTVAINNFWLWLFLKLLACLSCPSSHSMCQSAPPCLFPCVPVCLRRTSPLSSNTC